MPNNTAKESDFATVRVVLSGIPKSLNYELPEEYHDVDVGWKVAVEVGRSRRHAWVIEKIPAQKQSEDSSLESKQKNPKAGEGTKNKVSKFKLKKILEGTRAFNAEQLRLFEWMSSYYGSPLADIIDSSIPREAYQRKVLFVEVPEDKRRNKIELLAALSSKTPAQATIFTFLVESQDAVMLSKLESEIKGARRAVNELSKKGLLRKFEDFPIRSLKEKAPALPDVSDDVSSESTLRELTEAQSASLSRLTAALKNSLFEAFLMFGVTGSGKTEVYLRAIEQVLSQDDGGAIIIVPEIALTPQVIDFFESRLDSPIAVLHSAIGPAARWEAWQALLKGDKRIALGARSAVFAPIVNPKLIIVDEEHEASYKQSENPRYNARDVAVMRAKLANAALVLGSATPSFESLINVQSKRYKLLELPERATSRPVPQIEIIDLNQFKKKHMPSENISPPLFDALIKILEEKQQAVILYNRRGFASYLQCETCREALTCPNCAVTYTFYQSTNRLLCHYCGSSLRAPEKCPRCLNPQTSRMDNPDNLSPKEKKAAEAVGVLAKRGAGTEKVLEELSQLLPAARILRMDRDAVKKHSAYREILGSMRSGEADILVGTQMIAKGHDLPGVTLVGIIDADVGLHLPDFRSSERAFQLITQAAGRAGRGEEAGRVLVQTRQPQHPTIIATAGNRFKAFARYELEYRKQLKYPPHGRLLRLIVSSTDRGEAFDAAALLRRSLEELHSTQSAKLEEHNCLFTIHGPAPAPHEKLCNRYRWHLLIKSPSARVISETASKLYAWKKKIKSFKDFRLSIDVDPLDML